MKVFLSRPTDLNKENQIVIESFEEFLENRDIEAVTLGTNTFTNDPPMVAVKEKMKECVGAIILGFPQTNIKKGFLKYNTSKEEEIANKMLPTTWNHIEAAIAFSFNLPLLIIADSNISGGIFDIGVTQNFIHKYDLNTSDWQNQKKFLLPFNDWYKMVLKINN